MTENQKLLAFELFTKIVQDQKSEIDDNPYVLFAMMGKFIGQIGNQILELSSHDDLSSEEIKQQIVQLLSIGFTLYMTIDDSPPSTIEIVQENQS